MSRRYQLTASAKADVERLAEFIGKDSVDGALRVLSALEEAFEQLAAGPGIGHTRKDLTDRPVKFWSVYSYLVVYDPASSPLTVIAVLHGARDVAQILKNI